MCWTYLLAEQGALVLHAVGSVDFVTLPPGKCRAGPLTRESLAGHVSITGRGEAILGEEIKIYF